MLTGALHPHTSWFDTIQSKSLPVIGLSASRVKKVAKITCCYDFAFFWNLQSQAAEAHYVWVRASEVIWSEYTRIISVLSDAK